MGKNVVQLLGVVLGAGLEIIEFFLGNDPIAIFVNDPEE